jgi:hypothetical protein
VDVGRRALSTGLHALIAKPADSVPPVLATAVLESVGWTGAAMASMPSAEVVRACYRLVVLLPLGCGLIQVW